MKSIFLLIVYWQSKIESSDPKIKQNGFKGSKKDVGGDLKEKNKNVVIEEETNENNNINNK